MIVSAGSLIDPFALPVEFINRKFPSTNGRTIESFSELSGSIGVFIVAGQSLGSNSVDSVHAVTNQGKVHNLNIFDGGMYAMSDPLLGTDVGAGNIGNLFTRVADGLVTAGVFDHVIIVPTNAGGTTVREWDELYWKNISVANSRLLSLKITPTAVLWQQGESDNAVSTTSSSYQSSFNSMISKVVKAGLNIPWFLAKSTRYDAHNSNEVRLAIDALVSSSANLKAGPDTDSVTSRQADKTHLDDTGANEAAAMWVSILNAAYQQ